MTRDLWIRNLKHIRKELIGLSLLSPVEISAFLVEARDILLHAHKLAESIKDWELATEHPQVDWNPYLGPEKTA